MATLALILWMLPASGAKPGCAFSAYWTGRGKPYWTGRGLGVEGRGVVRGFGAAIPDLATHTHTRLIRP